VYFLVVLIELFSQAVMAEVLRANIEYHRSSRSLLATAKRLTLVHRRARSELPISVNLFFLLGVTAAMLRAKID